MMRLLAAVVLAALSASSLQAQVSGEIRDLVFTVRPLVFKAEDLGGKVQSLQLKETATETRIELPGDILFDFDKAEIRAAAEPTLKEVAELLRKRARGTVTIEGHTDSKGSARYNQKLSERRAMSVREWLVERGGMRNVRFRIKGYGAARPVAPNTKPNGADDPEGRQKNRRVEIVFGRR
jgi:outer membrane protein OmpA-like peptidoglycan-associated protein